jgi:hypothetical protein
MIGESPVNAIMKEIIDIRPPQEGQSSGSTVIFAKKPVEIVIKHPIKHSVFRMTMAIDPCHGRENDSQNGPESR